jgi:hypothetical protein
MMMEQKLLSQSVSSLALVAICLSVKKLNGLYNELPLGRITRYHFYKQGMNNIVIPHLPALERLKAEKGNQEI